MNVAIFVAYVASLSIVLWRSLEAIDRMNYRTWHGIRCVFLILAAGSFGTILELIAMAIYAIQHSEPWPRCSMVEVCFAVAVAGFLGLDRRRCFWAMGSARGSVTENRTSNQ